MLKKGILILFIIFSFAHLAFSQEDEQNISRDDVYSDIGIVELEGNAGLTPDNALYFFDNFFEEILIGNNPEKALKYKEEKIIEATQMIDEGKIEEAKKAFMMANVYSEILEDEVSPDIEKRVRESSKAVKQVFDEVEENLEGEEWEEIKEIMEEHKEKEDSIALAAKISKQIKKLCETLSELDPSEYMRVCKTSEDDPKWKIRLDKDLTEEQKKEAREFFNIMSECFKSPRECRCDDITISSFADKCNDIAPLAAECMEGNENACEQMEEIEDPIDLLPPYLQDVLEEVEHKYGDAKYELHMPIECREAGATSRTECMKVMFKINAPEECVEALEQGKISFTNEREMRKECEKIMFNVHAPPECIEAGITDPKECGRFMFKEYAPEECIESGLTGESREDERKCREIMEGVEKERHEKGIPMFGADCRAIENPEERLKCYDSAINEVGVRFEPPGGWPGPCVKEKAFSRESCEKIMRESMEEERREFKVEERRFEPHFECGERQILRCIEDECSCVESENIIEEQEERFPTEPEQIHEPSPEITPEQTTESPPESTPEQTSEQSTTETTPETSTESGQDNIITGEFLAIDNEFLDYYFR